MGVFGVFFGCSGDGGLNGCWSGACSGDGGFMLACISGCGGVIGCIVATSQRPVREKVRPAWSDGGCEREKVRPAYEKWPKIGGLWRAGRVSSHQPVLCQGLVDNAAHFRLAVVGVLQH